MQTLSFDEQFSGTGYGDNKEDVPMQLFYILLYNIVLNLLLLTLDNFTNSSLIFKMSRIYDVVRFTETRLTCKDVVDIY